MSDTERFVWMIDDPDDSGTRYSHPFIAKHEAEAALRNRRYFRKALKNSSADSFTIKRYRLVEAPEESK